MNVPLRALRGFIVDLVLAGAAAALRFHPLYAFFQEHPAVVYWGVGLAHIAIAPVLTMHAFGGGRRTRDLVPSGEGAIHGRVYRAALVAVLTTSFFVPFLCALTLRVAQNRAFSAAVFFAPYVFVALVMAPRDIGLVALRRTKFLFEARAGRVVLGVALTIYLVLMEATMFLCAESREPASLLAALLGIVLSYLPIRLVIFYVATKSETRAEVVSLVLGTSFLAAQIAAA